MAHGVALHTLQRGRRLRRNDTPWPARTRCSAESGVRQESVGARPLCRHAVPTGPRGAAGTPPRKAGAAQPAGHAVGVLTGEGRPRPCPPPPQYTAPSGAAGAGRSGPRAPGVDTTAHDLIGSRRAAHLATPLAGGPPGLGRAADPEKGVRRPPPARSGAGELNADQTSAKPGRITCKPGAQPVGQAVGGSHPTVTP